MKGFIAFSLGSVAAIAALGYFFPWTWWLLVLVIPLIIMGLIDITQKKHAIMRNYPIVGRLRYFMEDIRPKFNSTS